MGHIAQHVMKPWENSVCHILNECAYDYHMNPPTCYTLGLLDCQAEDILRRSEGKAEDVQIEWTEAEVYSNIDLDLSFA